MLKDTVCATLSGTREGEEEVLVAARLVLLFKLVVFVAFKVVVALLGEGGAVFVVFKLSYI